jgi:DNA (cytosine-5)-methyltransferase 1
MNIVDLFAGCGGLSLGLEQSGHRILAAYDNWDPALAVYRENFPEHTVIKQDLSDVHGSVKSIKKRKPDVIAGGPPCQDFSSAGTRNHSGARADLTYRYAEIVCEITPKFFVMENVERIRKSQVLLDVVQQLTKVGYGLTAVILDASYCGAPQARLRFFLIGHKGAPHQFLLGHLEQNLSPEPMTMRDYFGDRLGIDYYYRHPRNYNRRGIYGLDEPSATIRGVNRPIPPGYEMSVNDPPGVCLEQVRPLTTGERAQVQTFPESFRFLGPKTAQEQMIGNAVPVALGAFVGKALAEYLADGMVPAPTAFTLFADDTLLLPERPLRAMAASARPDKCR